MSDEAPKRWELPKRSMDLLYPVHTDLQCVILEAVRTSPIKFIVVCGMRSVAEQREMVRTGKSKTMNSRHLTGHAVDLAPWIDSNGDNVAGFKEVSWDWKHYLVLGPAVKQAAADLGVALDWGGDWKSFRDGPHFELRWKNYPL